MTSASTREELVELLSGAKFIEVLKGNIRLGRFRLLVLPVPLYSLNQSDMLSFLEFNYNWKLIYIQINESVFLFKISYIFFQDFGQGVAGLSRCDLKSNLLAAGCTTSALEFPTSKLQVIEDRPLSNKAAGATQVVTQIKPQKIHITLRPGEHLHIRI